MSKLELAKIHQQPLVVASPGYGGPWLWRLMTLADRHLSLNVCRSSTETSLPSVRTWCHSMLSAAVK